MVGSRRYSLLCPIARALDRIGDRWTLLILRDLHAGPARFSELQSGLSGIASNLLSDRLQQLLDDGLIEKRAGQTVYALTPVGEETRDLLFALALFGSRFTPDDPPRRPGNLRTVAVTLAAAAQRVVKREIEICAALVVDGESFVFNVSNGKANVMAGMPETPDLVATMDYAAMVSAFDGELAFHRFMEEHVTVETRQPGKAEALFEIFSGIADLLAQSRT